MSQNKKIDKSAKVLFSVFEENKAHQWGIDILELLSNPTSKFPKFKQFMLTKRINLDLKKEISDALNAAAVAKADAEKATSDYEKIKQEAQAEAQKILSEAKSVKEKMVSDAVLEAKTKAEAETKSALEAIDAEREKAVKEIKTAAVDLSIKAASKLIEKNLDSSDNRKLVSDTLDEVGQA